MSHKKPLDDAWFFWDAERVDEFPHFSDNDCTRETAHDDAAHNARERPRPAMLEDLMLYVGGIGAALLGMGLVILIGSFISAYSALNGAGAGERAEWPTQPYLSFKRPAPAGVDAPRRTAPLEPAPSATAAGGSMRPTRGAVPARERSGI